MTALIVGVACLFSTLLIYSGTVISFLRFEHTLLFVGTFAETTLLAATLFGALFLGLSLAGKRLPSMLLGAGGGMLYLCCALAFAYFSWFGSLGTALLIALAVAAALGDVCLALTWGRICARFKIKRALVAVSLASMLSAGICFLYAVLPLPGVTVLFVLSSIAAVIVPLAFSGTADSTEQTAPERAEGRTTGATLASLADVVVAPGLGLLVFAFAMAVMRTAFNESQNAYLAALALDAATLLAYTTLRKKRFALRGGMHQTFLPLMAMVLLALQENLHAVRWSYEVMNPDGGSDLLSREGTFTVSDANAWLDLSSSMIAQAGGIKALGTSPAGVQALLDYLSISGGETTGAETANALFQLAGEESPEALAETLVCSGPWGDAALEGTFVLSEKEGQLLLEFTQPNTWALAADGNRMSANATVLLALYPELTQVQARSVNGESFYIRATRETVIRLLSGGKTLSDYGTSPEALAELLVLLDGIVERDGLLVGVSPDGAVPYPASGGFVAQYGMSLPLGAETAALEAVTYCEGQETERQVVWRGSPLELPSDGFWLREYPQRSSDGWGPVEFTLLPWTDESDGAEEPLASWTIELPSGFHYDSRDQRGVKNAAELTANTSAVLFAAAFSDTEDAASTQEMQLPAAEELQNPAVLEQTLEVWDAVILVQLRLGS